MAFVHELPDDLLAVILRRLPPRSLAVSRCACRTWRDLVDDRRLLRADLLPHTVGGIFLNYYTYYSSEFLARPTTGRSIAGDLEFIMGLEFFEVVDHCNGLLLCQDNSGDSDHDYVANPATRRWEQLPPPPQASKHGFRETKCLVYDPILSPHYHVFLIGSSLDHEDQHKSALQVYVYSSETGMWEERWFVLESHLVEIRTTIAVDVKKPKVYWRGKLYLLCENSFILRISISTAVYTLIPTPGDRFHASFGLGSSEKGVYCALIYNWHGLQIFLLNESCGQTVWEMQHNVHLSTFALKLHARDGPNGPWILEDINYYREGHKHREVVENNFEWNSDDDNVFSTEDMAEGYISLLGFHPYKEVVFLNAALSRAVAYDWNTSKFQDLGNICPTDYCGLAGLVAGIETSFIYTPCWMEDFPQNSLEAPTEDYHSVDKQLLADVIE